MIRRLLLLFLLVFINCSLALLTAQTDIMITGNETITLDVVGGVNTTYNIIMPDNCKAKVTYEAWGGGGSGGEQKLNAVGGGGSGAYINCSTAIDLDCGVTYAVTVGAGGDPTGPDAGGNTIVNFGTLTTAAGGAAGNGNDGGAGGIATGCDVATDGNDGSGRATGRIGGVGGNAPNGGVGGAGGLEFPLDANGVDGVTPGGGGGGHGRGETTTSSLSGRGGDGRIILVITDYVCNIRASDAPFIICDTCLLYTSPSPRD